MLCGDARDPLAYLKLLQNERAQLVLTDPPFNVPIKGHVSGHGEVVHREFAMASGEMTPAEYTSFLRGVFQNLAEFSMDGSLHFIFQDWRHMTELMNAAAGIYTELKNLIVWNKTNGGMGSLYRSKHELIFLYKNGSAAHVNNVELGRNGRHRTNVWDYAGANTFKRGRLEELRTHPTCKPVPLLKDALLDCSDRNAAILDPFGGSGSILIAAERTNRRAFVLEIEPSYVDASIRRWQKKSGGQAVHAESGQSFDCRCAEQAKTQASDALEF